jgi:hypothetical protein
VPQGKLGVTSGGVTFREFEGAAAAAGGELVADGALSGMSGSRCDLVMRANSSVSSIKVETQSLRPASHGKGNPMAVPTG